MDRNMPQLYQYGWVRFACIEEDERHALEREFTKEAIT